MNDDRLVGLLSALRTERMERAADQDLRARLENAWTVRESQRGLGWRMRRPVLVLASAALVLGSIATTLSAPGDSALYTLRVTIEDLAIPLHRDPEDRAEYLVSLLEQRTAEAARLGQRARSKPRSRDRARHAAHGPAEPASGARRCRARADRVSVAEPDAIADPITDAFTGADRNAASRDTAADEPTCRDCPTYRDRDTEADDRRHAAGHRHHGHDQESGRHARDQRVRFAVQPGRGVFDGDDFRHVQSDVLGQDRTISDGVLPSLGRDQDLSGVHHQDHLEHVYGRRDCSAQGAVTAR